MNNIIHVFLEENRDRIIGLAHEIFGYAELAEEEMKSAAALKAYLEAFGFAVEEGVGGMPTALRAVKGSGKPVIGFLGEYDALPALDQPPVPHYCGDAEKPGHGCGHNLLGTGSATAAAALAYAMEKQGLPGTVVFYGCPAEEILKGKIVMAGNGCFSELDAALSWHPGMENRCGELAYLAMDSVRFHFHGKPAHASAAPYRGRSALDATELMNIGANYLREHVTDDVRIHYAPLPADLKPNVVPAEAGSWYFVRARERENLDDVVNRLLDIARGAALMTSTTVDWEFLSRGYGTLVNFTLCRLMHEVMCEVGHTGFCENEKAFAAELAKNSGFAPGAEILDETFDTPKGEIFYMTGSTDVSDVSQIVPTVNIRVACSPKGCVLHSWQFAACADSDIGRRGLMLAAEYLAQAGLRLMTEPQLLEAVKKEYQDKAKGFKPLM